MVLIVLGSKSDMEFGEAASQVLEELSIPHSIEISSAHRDPERTRELAEKAESKGYKVIIAMAGYAAHLPGFIASLTHIPVIGVHIDSSPLKGMDSLLSIVQMPRGVPVACMGIGKSGAKNAAILAAEILALSDSSLRERLLRYRNIVPK